MTTPSELHPELAELAFLLGDWSGTGEGIWPPGERFDYAEEVTFEFVGDPFLLYAQRSWSLDGGSPIHLERGFLRPAGPGIVELLPDGSDTGAWGAITVARSIDGFVEGQRRWSHAMP